MLLHPEIQKKCQAEIDAVCNNERLPDVADRDQLPYLNATMKELMRWQPVSPLGMFQISTFISRFLTFPRPQRYLTE